MLIFSFFYGLLSGSFCLLLLFSRRSDRTPGEVTGVRMGILAAFVCSVAGWGGWVRWNGLGMALSLGIVFIATIACSYGMGMLLSRLDPD